MADVQSAPDLRPLMQDLLRLGMDAPGFSNRSVSKIQLEHITNPYGRQPPHVLVFPDGRVERMTPFQNPVPGYGAEVLAVELLGYVGQPVTEAQLSSLRAFGSQVRQALGGRVGFVGNAELVATATTDGSDRPGFMGIGQPSMAPAEAAPRPRPSEMTTVQNIFDILGTPAERRAPLPPGSLFNSVSTGGGAAAVTMRRLFKAPGTRMIVRLVVVPSHEAGKPEPTDAAAYTVDALRKSDQRLGMSDIRGHYVLAKDGSLLPGRDLEVVGNCWPGKNEGAVQIVLAGNGKNPTVEQRQALYEYGVAFRKYYEQPMQACVRDVLYGEGLLGINPNGIMQNELANAALIQAPLVDTKNKAKAG